MPFSARWHTLLEECEALPKGATLRTPLSNTRFRITDVQEHRIIIELTESGESRPLQRDQFETLYHRLTETADAFDLDRLPPDADPYPAVLSLHPRFEVDEQTGTITETDDPTSTQLVDTAHEATTTGTESDRAEPEGLALYGDALLLLDALERHTVSALDTMETPALVNLYTLLSDVQRGADDLRHQVADVLLERIQDDQPMHGQYGSVQRTSRRRRTLKDEAEVLAALEAAGIDRERVLGLDREKVDEALEVTELSESDVYDIDERTYVRKAEVDEEVKESRLQGLKDRLAGSEHDEADALRQEVEELEARIEELTSFRTGAEVQ
jgi:acetolactate synthase small subunit